MEALDKGALTRKIIVTGKRCFWQVQLRHVFEKEGWKFIDLPEDYPDPQALLQVHNNSVVLYVLDDNRDPVTGTRSVQQLLDMLRISQAKPLQAFYLISTVAASVADDQTVADHQAAAMAECVVTEWSAMTGIPVGILRLPDVYGPGDDKGESLLDRCLLAAAGGMSAVLPEDQPGTRSFLYVDDAVYGIYRAVSRVYQGTPLNLVSKERLTVAGFAALVERLTGQPALSQSVGTAVYAQPVCSEQKAQDELGWRGKYALEQGAKLAWKAAQTAVNKQGRQRKRNQWRSAWRKRLQRAVPYLENLVGALLMLGASGLRGGGLVNPLAYFDLNFLYIGTMGLLYGKQQALIAMVLSWILLIGGLLQQGANLVGLMYQPEVLIHLISYLFVAVLTGYFADSRTYEREASAWQVRQAEERYDFLKGLHEENLMVKDRLYRQILNSDDSIGRLYRIIRKLDSVELENIFTQAAVVTAQVLNVDDIVVYVVSNQYYLRQKVRMGRLAEQQPRSLRVADYAYLQAVLHEKTIYVNRDLVKDAPDLAAPIIYQGEVIAVVEIFGMHFSQWTLAQQNLLSITTRLIAASMGRAYRYEAEIQARRYYGATRILQEKEFGKIIEELRNRRKLQQELSVAVLEVEMSGMDYPALDEKLASVIRSEDFVGNWQGHIYVLLPDADEEVTAMVQQRLQRAGLQTTVSEAVL
jgi:hypothetical protein